MAAKDKATGKENKITIKANSGLTEDEIHKMVKDAESHADEDKKRVAVTQARNNADAMVHSVEKSMKEHGEKLGADEKKKVEDAMNDVREALKGDDKDRIDSATSALMAASQVLGEKVYGGGEGGPGAGAGGQSTTGAGGAGGRGPSAGGAGERADGGREAEDVVDAEFKEVKRDA